MIRIILLALFIILQPLLATAADDCAKAKKLYDQATKRMNYHERRDLFRQAVKLCPSYAEAHVNLADACENLVDFDTAEIHYKEALKLNPELVAPYVGLGEVYLKTGRYTLAQEAFFKGIAISPEDDRLQAGLKVATERLTREKKLYPAEQIRGCIAADEEFRLMCMCPGDHYAFLRRWICIPPILFSSGSVSFTADSKRQLDEIGKALKSKELLGKKWLIIGHADSVGTPERNVVYSRERVITVKGYLVKTWDLNPASFTVYFFGQNRPRASNDTLEGRAENRRVEIVLDE